MPKGVDSGDQYLLGGKYYYRQLDELALNICVVHALSDAGWRQYLDNAMQIVTQFGHAPSVSLCVYQHAHPNAKQRRAAASLFAEQSMPSMKRVAVFTDSIVIKGAMTAFNWIMPSTDLRAFRAAEEESAQEVEAGVQIQVHRDRVHEDDREVRWCAHDRDQAAD